MDNRRSFKQDVSMLARMIAFGLIAVALGGGIAVLLWIAG